MKFRVAITLTAMSVVAGSLSAANVSAAPYSVVLRQDKAAAKPAKASAKDKEGKPGKVVPGQLTKKVVMAPKELQFGMTIEQVARVYDKVFDKEFLPLYKKAEPGSQMASLDAELRDKKALVRRNRIDFGKDPTGVDYTALKGEYSYGNGESMTRLPLRSGTTRNFFFIGQKLWKVYDEHKAGAGSNLGATFEQAVENLTKKFGAPPKLMEADYAKGRPFQEAVWEDPSLQIRVLNREAQGTIAVVYVDRNVGDNLARYRTNKAEDPHQLDREVKSATEKPPEDFNKPRPEELEKDKKGKGKAKNAGK